MLTTGNHVTSRPIIDLRCGSGYLRGISPHQKGISLARKILLADDSVTAQNMGRKILSDAGYEVVTVNNGSAALKKIAEHRPDLIVLDVYMPGYSGLEVCQRLKEAQETARIPVLLTVGKLEPFKPEEAQRVRAEGFIVKPFEASELLSALSKLEDKVVPRPEPSKPGRFARAIAAVEESSRSNDDAGWKERISFPGKKKKAEAEQKSQDDSAIYNPVNRDLRTVVEKPAAAPESKTPDAVEAKPSGGLPDDVTPEELAAIAAAMAQMQGSWADAQTAEQLVAKALNTAAAERAADQVAPAPAESKAEAPIPVEGKVEAAAEGKTESLPAETFAPAEEAAPKAAHAAAAIPAAEEAEEVPATMAATAVTAASSGQGPRWMAVPVALGTEESAISLEQEMQKAYAAFAAAEANHPGFVEPAAPLQAVAENSVSPEAMAEPSVALPTASEPEPAVIVAAESSSPVVAAVQSEVIAAAASAGAVEVESTFPQPVEAPALPSSVHEAAPAEIAVQSEVAAVVVPSTPEPLPAQEPEPEIATAAAGPSANAPVASEEPRHNESDTVASTAAAWASWRQVRDTGDTRDKAPEPSTPAFEVNVPASTQAESAAMAVAAGAEKIAQEASPASSSSDPTAIASIVESVLADLRPRLVEEISRKMAEKK